MKLWLNPFVLSAKGERPLDLAKEPLIRAKLLDYMRFRPRKEVARWFGASFAERTFEFILCWNRLVPKMYRDRNLLYKIIQYFA
jgi:hypothetical protein